MKQLLLFLLLWPFTPMVMADALTAEDIAVKVQVDGETVNVDVSLAVPATRQQVWDVLTDFGHMASFISNLKESKVESGSGDRLNISQRGTAQYGPINFPFNSIREIQLTPLEKIQSHMISGNMRKMEGTTLLTEEGAQVRILYHSVSIPGTWIPPLVGKSFIEHETREQFREMRTEILRRKLLPIAVR
jgi:hypothetical protein